MEGVLALAYGSAALSGFLLVSAATSWGASRARRRSAKTAVAAADSLARGSPDQTMVSKVLRAAGNGACPAWLRAVAASRVWGFGLGASQRLLAQAGFAGFASEGDVHVARVQATGVGLLAGCAAGSVFSMELAMLLGTVGAVAGYGWIVVELRRCGAARTADMERHLSEMLEVVVLGLRSGLSFERAFRLYPEYFDTELGQAMGRVADRWELGLMQREDALRSLEAEYDSTLLSRVVGSMVRSLRFGTSIADSLESVAVEAREVHKARMEERVAKVAVKMMLPVGTLILPAMLLLVLGPVLLELVQGF